MVNIPDRDGLLAEVERRLKSGRGFALATINMDHLHRLIHDLRFREFYVEHDLIVADGNPIVWLSRIAGKPVSLVPGSDMVLPLARIAAANGVSVALIGTTPDALAEAALRMRERVPGLRIVAQIAPPMGFDPSGPAAYEVLSRLNRSGAGLTFVALGSPRQEVFAAVGRQVLPRMGFASVGAGLDFIAGTQVRAPLWVRRIAMEWLWRMLSNPRRLVSRYLSNLLILPGQVLAALRLRLRPAGRR